MIKVAWQGDDELGDEFTWQYLLPGSLQWKGFPEPYAWDGDLADFELHAVLCLHLKLDVQIVVTKRPGE
jgi:hypothetical protein